MSLNIISIYINSVSITRRLGHDRVETTLDTYSHLYPNENMNLLNILEELEVNQTKGGI